MMYVLAMKIGRYSLERKTSNILKVKQEELGLMDTSPDPSSSDLDLQTSTYLDSSCEFADSNEGHFGHPLLRSDISMLINEELKTMLPGK